MVNVTAITACLCCGPVLCWCVVTLCPVLCVFVCGFVCVVKVCQRCVVWVRV